MLVEKLLRIPSYQSARLSKPVRKKISPRNSEQSYVVVSDELTCRHVAEIFQHIRRKTITQAKQ